jgi:alpha-glucosidase
MMKKNVRSFHLKKPVANRCLVRPLMLLVLGLFLGGWVDAGLATDRRLTLKSPDGKTLVTVQAGGHLRYDIAFHGTQVVLNSALGIVVDGKDLGAGTVFAGKPATREINEQYPVMGVHATAINHCFATVIPVTSGTNQWQLEFRVFNDGVACRYQVPGQGVRHINGEATEWNVPVGSALWSLSAANTSYEALFEADIVGQLPQGLQLMAPALLKFPGQAGYGMMTEANLINYSDLSLKMQ